jgi:hypothetical protein
MHSILIYLSLTLVGGSAYGQTFVATFVMSKGDVKILHPATETSTGPFLIYEGRKYTYESGRIGKKVQPTEILQTGTDGRAKIVYPNGDHFNLGPGTSMSLPVGAGADGKGGKDLNLLYGRVRALISKGGPLSNMKVKTPAATAGVRGTDFFLRHNPTVGSQISVLRGEVAVVTKSAPTKPVSVKRGYVAKIDVPTKNATEGEQKPNEVKVAIANKDEILEIQNETALRPDAKALAELPADIKKDVEELSKKSTAAVLTDIKKDDPKMYEEFKKKADAGAFKDSFEINTAVVARLVEQAPGVAKKKPTAEEMDAIGKDVYNDYFKPAK